MNEFNISTRIYFGNGTLKKLNELKNKNILIVCDNFIQTSGMIEKIKENIKDCSMEIFSDVIPDPTVETVALGLQKLRENNAEIIIAVGGGSVIDCAKAIREYNKKLNEKDNIEEFYAIPTTSGTGSEVTEYAVITNKEENLKYALTDKALLPTVAILDSELTMSVPRQITADTGMDVITHAIEAYMSRNATDFSDALAEKAIYLAFNNILKAFRNGNDKEAREKMHNASCIAGIAFNSAGLGITHSLAHAIGGKIHLPHGRANAIILPYVIEFNANLNMREYGKEQNEIAQRYRKIAKILDMNTSNTIIGVNNLIKKIFVLQKELMIPATLKQQGVDLELLKETKNEIISAALEDICTKANPREVSYEDLEKILNKVIG